MDLPPMDACPADRKRGRHHLLCITPETDAGDLTWFCMWCGAIRRAPVLGTLYAERLDDLDEVAIAKLFAE